jgi:glutathione S-transferase
MPSGILPRGRLKQGLFSLRWLAGAGRPTTVRVIGNYISPYVRKVLVCLRLKGLAYEIDPIVPFFGDDRFAALSPLRRIPVLIDGDVTLTDSTVICEYLDDRYPEPALRPRDAAARARGRWLEEFADTRMGDVFIWRLFNQVAIRPFVWGEPTDTAVVEKTLADDVPDVLGYLERELPRAGFLFGDRLAIADIAIASFFRNAAMARFRVDAERWPVTAAFVERALAQPAFADLKPFEKALMRVPIAQHRAALAELSAPLTRDSYASATPRRGVMPI